MPSISLPITYAEPVYRPPSEAQSLLIQVTIGCSHNACTFCAMYRNKQYRVRPLREIGKDLEKAAHFYAQYGQAPRKIFLCDGDALAAPTELLLDVLRQLRTSFPSSVRVGIYASVRNILEKSAEDLAALAAQGLRIAYVGVESGADAVLALINKRVTAEETIQASYKLRHAGWKMSQIYMLGVGGKKLSSAHCRESSRVISETAPNFLSFLTTTVVPSTPYAARTKDGSIELLSVRELLQEMGNIIQNITPKEGQIIFRANHVSNLFPLEGNLPRDRTRLVDTINEWIRVCPADQYPEHDPRYL